MKLIGKTREILKWLFENEGKRCFILVPDEGRKRQVIAYAKSIGLDSVYVEAHIRVAGCEGLESEGTTQ